MLNPKIKNYINLESDPFTISHMSTYMENMAKHMQTFTKMQTMASKITITRKYVIVYSVLFYTRFIVESCKKENLFHLILNPVSTPNMNNKLGKTWWAKMGQEI